MERPSAPNRAFKNELRGQLLDQYEQSSFSLANLGRWAGTAVAFILLAIAVLSIQQVLSGRSSVAAPVSVTRPAIQTEVIYDSLLISWLAPDGTAVELTAESWQTVDGTQFRGQVSDPDGNLLHFAQSDGISLWRTFQSHPDPGWYPANQIYQMSAADYHPPQGTTVPEWVTAPPFYSGLAWEGLVTVVLQPAWDCTDFPCVIEQLRNPAVGIKSADAESENYGWGGSLIDTETGEDGRSLSILRIDFAPRELEGQAAAQYRLVKVDSETFTVREVTDYDNETMTRRLQRLERQTLAPNTLPAGFFSTVPDSLLVVPWQPQANAEDRVWLINASPAPGTNLSSLQNRPTTIEMEIGYELRSAPEALAFVELLPGDWDLQSAGFPPYLGNSGVWIPISAENSSITIPVQLSIGVEPAPASIVADVKLILRDPQTAYFFHQETLTESRWLFAKDGVGTAVSQPGLSSFSGGPILTSHALSATAVQPGDVLDVTLFWEGEDTAGNMVAVHLTDGNGKIISQQDQPLANEMELSLTIPETTADDTYEIVVIKYDSTSGQRLDSLLLAEIRVGTAVASPLPTANDVWLIAATQHARSSTNAAVTLEITIGYQFESSREMVLRPFYANLNWESVSDGILPIDYLSDPIILSEPVGTQTITFTQRPEVMRQYVDTNHPILAIHMGYLVENESGVSGMQTLVTHTITDPVIDLTSTEEILFGPVERTAVPQRAVVNGTEGNGLTLRSAPAGQDIAILEEGSFVLLIDAPRQEGEGLTWQAVETIDGQTGWVVAEFLAYPSGYVPVDAPSGEEAEAESLDSLTIVNISPPVGSDLSGNTTFTVTVDYNLTSLDTANIITSLLPNGGGAAVLGNNVNTISQGEGEITYSFEFEPLDPSEPSDWILDIKMVDPAWEPTDLALVATSPHDNFPEDVYHYEP